MTAAKPPRDKFPGRGLRHTERAGARLAVIEAVALQLADGRGKANFSKSAIVKQFEGRVSRTQLYEWIKDAVEGGEASKVLKESRAIGGPVKTVRRRGWAASKPATMPVMEMLAECVSSARQIMQALTTEDGKVKNSRMFLTASEHLRRSLETAAKIYSGMEEIQQVAKFHAAVVEELRLESPTLAARVVQRMQALSRQWGVAAPP